MEKTKDEMASAPGLRKITRKKGVRKYGRKLSGGMKNTIRGKNKQ